MTRRDRVRQAVRAWNEQHPPGTPVQVRRDGGEVLETRTRSAAEVAGDVPVIWLEGVRGCYRLDRVSAREACNA